MTRSRASSKHIRLRADNRALTQQDQVYDQKGLSRMNMTMFPAETMDDAAAERTADDLTDEAEGEPRAYGDPMTGTPKGRVLTDVLPNLDTFAPSSNPGTGAYENTHGFESKSAAVYADLEDAVNYVTEVLDYPISIDELELVDKGEMNPRELPVLDSSHLPSYNESADDDDDGEGHFADRREPHIKAQFDVGKVNPVIIIETEDFEILADGYGRASYALRHKLSVPFERYRASSSLRREACTIRPPAPTLGVYYHGTSLERLTPDEARAWLGHERQASAKGPWGVIDGWGGRCGSAAIALNRALFGGRGTYIIGANVALLEYGERLVGHVAVKSPDGQLYDADGPTSEDTLESWGMLDEHDSDYRDALREVLGREPLESDFYEAGIYEVSEEELFDLNVADETVISQMIQALNQHRSAARRASTKDHLAQSPAKEAFVAQAALHREAQVEFEGNVYDIRTEVAAVGEDYTTLRATASAGGSPEAEILYSYLTDNRLLLNKVAGTDALYPLLWHLSEKGIAFDNLDEALQSKRAEALLEFASQPWFDDLRSNADISTGFVVKAYRTQAAKEEAEAVAAYREQLDPSLDKTGGRFKDLALSTSMGMAGLISPTSTDEFTVRNVAPPAQVRPEPQYAMPSKFNTPEERAAHRRAKSYINAVVKAADAAGIAPELLDAVVWTESKYRSSAKSGAGAMGLVQMMPSTAKDMEKRFNLPPVDFSKDDSVLHAGAQYLKYLLIKYKDRPNRVELALAAYNAGEGNVRKHNYIIPPFKETQDYVQRVLARMKSSPINIPLEHYGLSLDPYNIAGTQDFDPAENYLHEIESREPVQVPDVSPDLASRTQQPARQPKTSAFDIEAQMAGVKLYHGTSTTNLPGILSEGFRMDSDNLVFFTADFEKAAGYGFLRRGQGNPAVIETYFSKPKRVRKFEYDPHDREDVWDQSGYVDLPYEIEEARDYIYEGWSKILEALNRESKYVRPPVTIEVPDDMEYLHGVNLYKEILTALEAYELPQDRSALVRLVRSTYPAGDYGFLHVREDGSLALNQDWYLSREQLRIKGDQPKQVIKRIWVRLEDYPTIVGDTIQIGASELPQESHERITEGLERLSRVSNDLRRLTNAIASGTTQDVVFEALERVMRGFDNLKDTLSVGLGKQIYKSDLDEITRFADLIESYLTLPEGELPLDDITSFIDEVIVFAEGLEEGLNEAYGETQATSPMQWVAVSPDDAQRFFTKTAAEVSSASPKYFYHVTVSGRIPSIAQHGLGQGQPMFTNYQFNTKGKSFLTEAAGAAYWQERVWGHAADYGSSASIETVPVLLRVDTDFLESEYLEDDTIGAADSRAKAWAYSEVIDPSYIEYWSGASWLPLEDVNDLDDLDIERLYTRKLDPGLIQEAMEEEGLETEEDLAGIYDLEDDRFHVWDYQNLRDQRFDEDETDLDKDADAGRIANRVIQASESEMTPEERKALERVRQIVMADRKRYPRPVGLSPAYLSLARNPPPHPTYGYCSVAADLLYDMLGGEEAGYELRVGSEKDAEGKTIPGTTHWWVQRGDIRLDPTAEQFTAIGQTPPYEDSTRKAPSSLRHFKRLDRPSNRVEKMLKGLEHLLDSDLDKDADAGSSLRELDRGHRDGQPGLTMSKLDMSPEHNEHSNSQLFDMGRSAKRLALQREAKVWHGTLKAFVELDPGKSGLGTHFGTLHSAMDRLTDTWFTHGNITQARVILYDITPSNLLRCTDIGTWDDPWAVLHEVMAPFLNKVIDERQIGLSRIAQGHLDDLKQLIDEPYNSYKFWKTCRRALEQLGYDGIVYRNKEEDPGHDSFIIWDPEKIEYLGEDLVSREELPKSKWLESSNEPYPGDVPERFKSLSPGGYRSTHDYSSKLTRDPTKEAGLRRDAAKALKPLYTGVFLNDVSRQRLEVRQQRHEAKVGHKRIALTLWHGTAKAYVPQILEFGLVPGGLSDDEDSAGGFVDEMYDEYSEAGVEITPAVYAADKHTLQKAENAMRAAVARVLGKSMWRVTDEDIREHGALIKIKEGDKSFTQYPKLKKEDWREQEHLRMELSERGLHAVEPGDWYSEESISVETVITGPAMMRVLNRGKPKKQHSPKQAFMEGAHLQRQARLVQKSKDGKKQWALVSTKDSSKVLKWFGTRKPSEEAVEKEEKRVQYFKHRDAAKVPKPVYTGVFLDDASRQRLEAWWTSKIGPLHSKPYMHHLTLTFRPDMGMMDFLPFGEDVSVVVRGYAESPSVQAVAVKVDGDYTITSGLPHVTVATDGTPPKASLDLLQKGMVEIEGPTLMGRLGWSDGQSVHYEWSGEGSAKEAQLLDDGFEVSAGILEDVKAKYPKVPSIVEALSEADPSGRNKYLETMMRFLVSTGSIESLEVLVKSGVSSPRLEKVKTLIQDYVRLLPNMPAKDRDIRSMTMEQVENAIYRADTEKLERGKAKIRSYVERALAEGAQVIWEGESEATGDKQLLISLESNIQVVAFGQGTKWCLAVVDSEEWPKYRSNFDAFYGYVDLGDPRTRQCIQIPGKTRYSHKRFTAMLPVIWDDKNQEVYEHFLPKGRIPSEALAAAKADFDDYTERAEKVALDEAFLIILSKSDKVVRVEDAAYFGGLGKEEGRRGVPQEVIDIAKDALVEHGRPDEEALILGAAMPASMFKKLLGVSTDSVKRDPNITIYEAASEIVPYPQQASTSSRQASSLKPGNLRKDAGNAELLAEMEKYVDTGAFFTLSDVPKFSMKPTYGYGTTPAGFYGYPLTRATFENWKSGHGETRFARERSLVLIWRFADDANVLELGEPLPKDLKWQFKRFQEQALYEGREEIADVVRKAPLKDPATMDLIERFIDSGSSYQYGDEEYLSYGDLRGELQRLDEDDAVNYLETIFRDTTLHEYLELDTIDDWIGNKLFVAEQHGGEASVLFRTLWILAGGDVFKWSKELRDELDLDGVVDVSGRGGIHVAEPAQGVAFRTSAIQSLSVIENPFSEGKRLDKSERRHRFREQEKVLNAVQAGRPVNLLDALFAQAVWSVSPLQILYKMTEKELEQARQHPDPDVVSRVEKEFERRRLERERQGREGDFRGIKLILLRRVLEPVESGRAPSDWQRSIEDLAKVIDIEGLSRVMARLEDLALGGTPEDQRWATAGLSVLKPILDQRTGSISRSA